MIFIFSLYGISRKVGNPFDRFDNSYFTYHDLGKMANDTAENVDLQLDSIIEESISFRSTGKYHKDSLIFDGNDGKTGLPDETNIVTSKNLIFTVKCFCIF